MKQQPFGSFNVSTHAATGFTPPQTGLNPGSTAFGQYAVGTQPSLGTNSGAFNAPAVTQVIITIEWENRFPTLLFFKSIFHVHYSSRSFESIFQVVISSTFTGWSCTVQL